MHTDALLLTEHGRLFDGHAGARTKAFTLHCPVLQATWTRFPSMGQEDALCILQEACITTCTRGGFLMDTPITGVTKLWPCSQGLLLQMQSSGVLLLDHPAGSAVPVLADCTIPAGQPSAPAGTPGLVGLPVSAKLAGWCGETVLWSSVDLPWVLTYSKDAKRAAVWYLSTADHAPVLGHLPELPAVTPAAGWAASMGFTPGQPCYHGAPPSGGYMPQQSPADSMMTSTPLPSATPPGFARSTQSAWPSALKRPQVRTSTGCLSPAMFSARPRGALGLAGLGWGPHHHPSADNSVCGAATLPGSTHVPTAFMQGGSPLAGVHRSAGAQVAAHLVSHHALPGVEVADATCFPITTFSRELALIVVLPRQAQLLMLSVIASCIPCLQAQACRGAGTSGGRRSRGCTPAPGCSRGVATGVATHMVILDPGGTLRLYHGCTPLCTLNSALSLPALDTLQQDLTLWRLLHTTGQVPGVHVLPTCCAISKTGRTVRIEMLDQTAGQRHTCQAVVEVQPCSWLAKLVLETLMASIPTSIVEQLLAALHQLPGWLSGCGDTEWDTLCWLLEASLSTAQQGVPPPPSAQEIYGAHTDPQAAASSNQAYGGVTSALPVAGKTAYSSPGSQRFAALSLSSPAARKAMIYGRDTSSPTTHSQPLGDQNPTARGSSSSAWDALQSLGAPECMLGADTHEALRAGPWTPLRGGDTRDASAHVTRRLTLDTTGGPTLDTPGSAGSAMDMSLGSAEGDALGQDQHTTSNTAVDQQDQTLQGAGAQIQGCLRTVGVHVVQHLHLLYQELKLDLCRWPALPQLGRLAAQCAQLLGDAGASYSNYYQCELCAHQEGGISPLAAGARSAGAALDTKAQPLDACSELINMAYGRDSHTLRQALGTWHPGEGTPGPSTSTVAAGAGLSAPGALPRLQALYRMFGILRDCTDKCGGFCAEAGSKLSDCSSGLRRQLCKSGGELALAMVELGWSRQDLETLPLGLALPLRHMLWQCRTHPPPGWSPAAYALVGRDDIAATVAAAGIPIASPSTASSISADGPHETAPLRAASDCSVQPKGGLPPRGEVSFQGWAGQGGPAPTSQPLQTPTAGLPPRLATPEAATPQPGNWAARMEGRAHQTQAPGHVASATRHPQRMWRAGSGSNQGNTPSGWISWRPAYQQHLHLAAHHAAAVQSVLRPAVSATGTDRPAFKATAAVAVAATPEETLHSADSVAGVHDTSLGMRFRGDQRLTDASLLLSSSRPVRLTLDLPESDPDLPVKQQQQLLASALRTMALPVGRGALCLGTVHALPTEPLVIPPLCLAGLCGEPHPTTVNLDLSTAHSTPGAAADITAWPEFHNGVAAGLRLASQQASSHAPSTVQQCLAPPMPEAPSYTHAGLMLALGITGHLSRMAWTDVYRYLTEQHEATTIATMLGRAAYARGSMDAMTSKLLCLHLPSTHPSTFPELELSPLIQAAALLGVGLVFEGTCHRQMAEAMLQEISRTPSPGHTAAVGDGWGPMMAGSAAPMASITSDREGYALAAGFALGLITLGTGRQAAGLHDLNIESRLRSYLGDVSDVSKSTTRGAKTMMDSYMSAAVAPLRHRAVSGASTGAAGWTAGAGPLVGGHALSLAAHVGRLPGRDASADSGATQGGSVSATAPQVILEGAHPNLSVTSPAACMALTLMFLQTNDIQAASTLAPPSTRVALQSLRPDLLRLRALGRVLVMWDEVQPTDAWLKSQLPTVITDSDLAAVAGRCFKKEGPAQSNALAVLLAHINILAGACLGLGLRHAGSGDKAAYALLHKQLERLLRCKRQVPDAVPVPGPGVAWWAPPSDTSVSRVCMDKGHVEACVAVVVVAMGLVMAGSGDVPTLKLFSALSQRKHPSLGHITAGSGSTYGTHMAVSMATGLLFLGSGGRALTTSPSSVAALLIATYPVWPSTPLDNRNHLQAFRHLYVLAAQQRCVEAVDILTQQMVYLPVDVVKRAPKRKMEDLDSGGGAASQQLGRVLTARNTVNLPGGTGAKTPAIIPSKPATYPTAAGGSTIVHCVAPCLLPELDQVQSVVLTSDRYWPQTLTKVSEAPTAPGSLDTTTQQPVGALALHLSVSPGLTHSVPHGRTSTAGGAPVGRGSVGGTPADALLAAASSSSWGPVGYGGSNTSIGSRSRQTRAGPAGQAASASQLVFVRTRTGAMSHADDPSGTRSMLAQTYMGLPGLPRGAAQRPAGRDTAGSRSKLVQLLAVFNADLSVLGCAYSLEALWQMQATEAQVYAGSREQHTEAQSTEKEGSWSGVPGQGLLEVCQGVLCGCVTREQLGELTVGEHLQLQTLRRRLQTLTAVLKSTGTMATQEQDQAVVECMHHQGVAQELQSLRSLLVYLRSPLAAAAQLVANAGSQGHWQQVAGEAQQLLLCFVEGLWGDFEVLVDNLQTLHAQQDVSPQGQGASGSVQQELGTALMAVYRACTRIVPPV